jgi:protein-S-isoprenylcysteine O-methyltransferase Ste14
VTRQDKGLAAYQNMRRLVIALLMFVLVLVLVFVGSAQSDPTHELIEAYGIMLIMVGIFGRLWSILYIGGRKSAEVVSVGPYSVTRNPLYLFSSVAAVGAGAQTGSLWVALAFGVLCAVAFHVVIRREEGYLAGKLGATYRDYLARVPRFLPNPFIYRDLDIVSFEPRIFKRTLIDGLVFFVSIPFFEALEWGQQSGSIPVLLSLH